MIPFIITAIECPEDRDLMTEFYTKYNGLLYHEAKKHLDISEDIEDTVYEAFAKIIDKIEVFRELAPWSRVQYALTTVRNLSYLLLKKKNRFEFVPFDFISFDILATEETFTDVKAQRNILNENIRTIWNSLDIEDKILLEQKYILEWTDQEIALHLQIQSQSVRMRLTRAKRRLVTELTKNGFNIQDWL